MYFISKSLIVRSVKYILDSFTNWECNFYFWVWSRWI